MKLIKLKPNTPGTRHAIKIDKSLLLKDSFLFKNLIKHKHSSQGRSSLYGRITVRHKGSGCKKKYRDIKFNSFNHTSVVIAIAYDPYRTSFISLNFDLSRQKFFTTIAPHSLYTGFVHSCQQKFDYLRFGYRTAFIAIPPGSVVNNISVSPKHKAIYARAAGTSCQIVQKTSRISKIRLPSGKIIDVNNNSYATLGVNSNIQHKLTCSGKAGKNRLKGVRPTVRGIAMNPVDHPHGGRTNSGFVYVTPWGIPTKGKKTKNE
jgi:large subunit ribosomal protein L2